ncbi:hypothetical protein JCM3770_001763 [Rhodotorula araucariae]
MSGEPLLPPAYSDPEGYLLLDRFHRQTTYPPSYAPDLALHSVSYAVSGALDPSAPTVVWLNGLGGHRLAASLLDGLFLSRGVRLLTLDRPGGGRSTQVPLAHRAQASLEALLAVLAAEGATTFSLLSHSNGVLYALYALLHLPPHLTVTSWALSSPWVPPWHSGSALLSLARWIPPALTGRLGTLAGVAQRLAGPLERSAGWSAGLVRDGWSSGLVSLGTTAAPVPVSAPAPAGPGTGDPSAPAPAPETLPPPAQLARFRRLNAARAPHRRLFGGEYLPPGLFARGVRMAMDEGMDAMGAEALMCLRLGGARWGWEEDEADGEAVDEAGLYERGFAALQRAWAERGKGVEVSVWYGEEDALVPRKGREYLRGVLVGRLGMVDPEQWHEVRDAGHDDTLGLCCVMEPLLEGVLRSHARQ